MSWYFFFKLVETRKNIVLCIHQHTVAHFLCNFMRATMEILSQTQFIFHAYLLLLRTLLMLIDADAIFFSLRHFYYE